MLLLLLVAFQSYIHPGCKQALGSLGWRCQSVHVAYPYITSPLMVMQYVFDTYVDAGLKQTAAKEEKKSKQASNLHAKEIRDERRKGKRR